MNQRTTPEIFETTYDLAAVKNGVVHLGYGAFHRAHQAVFIDDYMDRTGDLRWGITAINLRAPEAEEFAKCTGAYLLKSVAPNGETKFRLVRAHTEFKDWTNDAADAEAALASPDVHMVTITVTESGYYTDPQGALNPQHPVIQSDISGATPQSVYAYLTAALKLRVAAGGAPLTILCCDNIRSNGKMLSSNLKSYLKLAGEDALLAWVNDNATFPCSMVDRITPRATDESRADIEALVGRQSTAPLMAEDFIQWVLQDNFAGPMPDLAKADVTVTDDVDPYEETKIRILNGGHTCLAYLAALEGIETFDKAMEHPALAAHFDAYEKGEVLPGLTLDLPFDKADYLASIAARFRNPAIADTVARICADGMAKFPIFIRPTLESCLKQGILPEAGFKSIASWYVFARRVNAGMIPFKYIEPSWEQLQGMLPDTEVEAFLTSHQLWGDLPSTYPTFVPALRAALQEMDAKWPV